MKERPARSFEKAVQLIIDGIGEKAASEAVNRSTSLIRKWSDPDHSTLPSIKQALALDEAYGRLTKLPPPLGTYYTHYLHNSLEQLEPHEEPILQALFNLQVAVGSVVKLVSQNIKAQGPSGVVKLTPRTCNSLLSVLETVERETKSLEHSVAVTLD